MSEATAMNGQRMHIGLRQVAKTFPDGTRALKTLDLEIAEGETLVLLGPSGCGKTTLLRIIAGLETPDAGGAVFFGAQDVTPLPIERRNVGMVFQSYALFPNMSVAENVGYGLRIRGELTPQKVDELLALVQLEGLGNRRVDQLSGGQRQRVALARALAVRPRVLLLDEPLTALDAKVRTQLREEIRRIQLEVGTTTLFVTHDQEEALAIADRVGVMRNGRIEQLGSPTDLYIHPATPFVAEFVG